MHSCTPAAPKVCPVRDFVELTIGISFLNTDFIEINDLKFSYKEKNIFPKKIMKIIKLK